MQKLARIDPALEVLYLTGLTRAQTSARVSMLERDDLVLYLTMLRLHPPAADWLALVEEESMPAAA